MPVDRTLAQDLADVLVELYRGLETRLVRDIARDLAADIDRDDWMERKLSALRGHARQTQELIRLLDSELAEKVGQQLALAYFRGSTAALEEITRITGIAVPDRDALPGAGAIQRLVFALVSLLRGTHLRILRWDLDAYRDVVAKASVDVLAGTHTRLRAAQIAWEQFLAQGITGFVDKSGRRWQLTSYVEMAVRSTVAQAAVQGHLDQLGAAGEDLVIVSDAPQECVLCRPWEGKVLTINGAGVRTVEREHGTIDGRMVRVHVAGSVPEAVAQGFMHPNCRHRLALYIPGVTRIPTNTEDPQGDADRQRLRELERNVRHWKRREAGALTPEAKKRAAAKVKQWQAEIRDHVEETGLLRQRHREQLPTRGTEGQSPRQDPTPPEPTPPTPDLESQEEQAQPLAPIGSIDLGAASDDDLANLLGDYGDDTDAFDQILAEMDRRDAADTAAAEHAARVEALAATDLTALSDEDVLALWRDNRDVPAFTRRVEEELTRRDQVDDEPVEDSPDTDEDLRIDELVAQGWEYRDAYAEVHGLDRDKLERQERLASLDADQRAGETRDQTVRRLYDEWVHLQWLAAENATRGHLLSKAGRSANVDPISLFSGPAARARKYASDDLKNWWAEHERVTFTEFKAQILGRERDRREAEQIRGRGNDKDFGL